MTSIRVDAGPSPTPANVSATIACEKCRYENTASSRFCRECGRSLWRACPACEQTNPAGESFCGHCGVNLRQRLQQQQERIAAALQQARQLAEQHQYSSAITCLQPYRTSDDDRLEELVQQVQHQIAQFQSLAEQGRATADSAAALARNQLESHAFDQALATLTAVPEPLRDDAFCELLRQVTDRHQQFSTLTNNIRAACDAGRLEDLAVAVDQMLALQPSHSQATRLAEKLRDKFCRLAERRLDECRYADALDVLQQTPRIARDHAFEKLLAQAAELDCLLSELRQGALADRTLMAVADRLVSLAPNNPEAAALRSQIQRRSKEPPQWPRQHTPDWSQPSESRFALPAAWWALPTSISHDGETAARFAAEPGRFAVAIGLALQGVEAGPVATNLMPGAHRPQGVLNTLSRLRKKRASTAAWGIDIGSAALKAVRLTRDEQGRLAATDAVLIEHATPATAAHREQWRTAVEQTLRQFCEARDMSAERSVVGIAGRHVLGRFFTMPPMDQRRLADAVGYQAQRAIPIPLEETMWDYHAFGEPPNKGQTGAAPRRVLVVAAKRFFVDELLQLTSQAGLNVHAVQCDCVALHNAAQHEFFAPDIGESAKPAALGLIDVGAQTTNLLITAPDGIWFRSFGVGGENFTAGLVRQFQLTKQQAEAVKRQPTRVRKWSALNAAIEPACDLLLGEIGRSIESYRHLFPADRITHLHGVGGGFRLHGLLRRLRNHAGRPPIDHQDETNSESES